MQNNAIMLDVEVAENMYHPCLGCGKYRCPHNRYLHSNVSAALIFYTALRNAVSARLAELAQELPAPALAGLRAHLQWAEAALAAERGDSGQQSWVCSHCPAVGTEAEMRAHVAGPPCASPYLNADWACRAVASRYMCQLRPHRCPLARKCVDAQWNAEHSLILMQ